MTVQHLRMAITAALEQYFPHVPVYIGGETPQEAFFHPQLISVTYERLRAGRITAVYRFGIRYKRGNPLEAEDMVDQLQEALAQIVGEEGLYRGLRQIWTAGDEGDSPLFTVEYMLQLQSEQVETVMMGHVTGGGRLI